MRELTATKINLTRNNTIQTSNIILILCYILQCSGLCHSTVLEWQSELLLGIVTHYRSCWKQTSCMYKFIQKSCKTTAWKHLLKSLNHQNLGSQLQSRSSPTDWCIWFCPIWYSDISQNTRKSAALKQVLLVAACLFHSVYHLFMLYVQLVSTALQILIDLIFLW